MIELENWRNFRKINVDLRDRMFVVGPNAAGKSNFLDVFRFLRDIAKAGGGLQKAIYDRGGVSTLRCFAARRHPDIHIKIDLKNDETESIPKWQYEIGIKQQQRGDRKPVVTYERVWKSGENVLDRPDEDDKKDADRLTQTALEQINANSDFREIVKFLERVTYLHLVPQLVRHPREFSGPGISGDPFGRSFLEKIGSTQERTRKSRLSKIENALKIAVPQLTKLEYVTDSTEGGIPHLEAVYEHWRPNAGRQREREFSDGTLRLIGLLWSLLEGDGLLLLEEPELSLNSAIVEKLAPLFYRIQRQRSRQMLISTHSADLLSDRGIGPEEVLLLEPDKEGTIIKTASSIKEVVSLLKEGMNIGETVLPRTRPDAINQLTLFE
jgi:predicted ATPase